jgi:hypothetical protein
VADLLDRAGGAESVVQKEVVQSKAPYIITVLDSSEVKEESEQEEMQFRQDTATNSVPISIQANRVSFSPRYRPILFTFLARKVLIRRRSLVIADFNDCKLSQKLKAGLDL